MKAWKATQFYMCKCRHMKEVKGKGDLFLLLPPLLSSLPQFDHNNQEKTNMISRILPALQFIYSCSIPILKHVHQSDGKRQPR
jgi:hypothetical protein